MARGFDSKSVEAQQEEAQREKVLRPAISAEERARLDLRRQTELALAAKRSELANASSDAHKAYLKRAISDLEALL